MHQFTSYQFTVFSGTYVGCINFLSFRPSSSTTVLFTMTQYHYVQLNSVQCNMVSTRLRKPNCATEVSDNTAQNCVKMFHFSKAECSTMKCERVFPVPSVRLTFRPGRGLFYSGVSRKEKRLFTL